VWVKGTKEMMRKENDEERDKMKKRAIEKWAPNFFSSFFLLLID